MSNQETFEFEVIEMKDPDNLIPKSFLVKVYKVTLDEESDKKIKELDKTITYLPKIYRGKKGKFVKKIK